MVIIQHPSGPNDRDPDRYGRIVEFGGRRDRGRGYMAHSDRVGQGILLLHEWFGLQDSFRKLADRLCEEGFTVLAPDLYDGAVASTPEEAAALRDRTDTELTARRVEAAGTFLTENWHPRLGVIGFSWGAGWATWLAQKMSVEATVLFYGTGEADASRWHGALQGHFAESDDFEPIDDVRAFMVKLEDGGVEVDAHVYPGTGHWFANPDVPASYDETAASQALGRTLEFFRHNLA